MKNKELGMISIVGLISWDIGVIDIGVIDIGVIDIGVIYKVFY